MKLTKAFYTREDVITISKELLGKYLVTFIDGRLTSGMIVETEAYLGAEDKASHAYGNRKTKRTEPFYKEGGIAYVYMCYGIHYLFNIITNKTDIPHAVLIRALEPSEGLDAMLERRKKTKLQPELTAGPGALSVALGISANHNETDLSGNEIWVEDRGVIVKNNEIIASPRVGVAYAKEYALKPWRFRIKDNPYTSKAR
ncbi:3-methyladenine DNA glycosylase [Sporocytophaga myxococcoides]|uniref:Putative 3-methyladenine DNA glycosylase n=1 Tax=Sporocytophaga myxococcoides TaxID=153721 RepID=A0A098LG10_9BACT|nr:DNA-3-methyladenine glycosylase [Sporocytophaga myxococcoides]GAL85399.1 3-methyladenine DNA glycosylase [Sporocytophaga myxococcoides]